MKKKRTAEHSHTRRHVFFSIMLNSQRKVRYKAAKWHMIQTPVTSSYSYFLFRLNKQVEKKRKTTKKTEKGFFFLLQRRHEANKCFGRSISFLPVINPQVSGLQKESEKPFWHIYTARSSTSVNSFHNSQRERERFSVQNKQFVRKKPDTQKSNERDVKIRFKK